MVKYFCRVGETLERVTPPLPAPRYGADTERSEYSCIICGWNEISPSLGYSPLQIDHINGDWTDNSPKNLRVICPNCHSLTPTYGSQNTTIEKNARGRGLQREYKG